MRLLAIDCATNACSAALWLDGEEGPARRAAMQRGHAEALLPMVADVMAEARLEFSALHGIAATVGPGAFTGIRIGLSAARGLALAAGLPVLGVTTLETVAAAQEAPGIPILVALDSKREDIYLQLFETDGRPAGEPAALLPRDAGDLLPPGVAVAVAGDMAGAVCAALVGRTPAPLRLDGPDLPDATVVARLAASRFALSPPSPGAPAPSALYLRPPDVTPKAARG